MTTFIDGHMALEVNARAGQNSTVMLTASSPILVDGCGGITALGAGVETATYNPATGLGSWTSLAQGATAIVNNESGVPHQGPIAFRTTGGSVSLLVK